MGFNSIQLKDPAQCHLWQKENLTKQDIALDKFEIIHTFIFESYFIRRLIRCKQCRQLYVYEFYEQVNWEKDKDSQYQTYIPVETEAEAKRIAVLYVLDLLEFVPRIQMDFSKKAKNPSAHWIK